MFCQSEHLDVNIREFMSFTLTWELAFGSRHLEAQVKKDRAPSRLRGV